MATDPITGGSGGGGRSSGGDPITGGSSGSARFSSKTINRVLRNSVASGDVNTTRRTAQKLGISDRDLKALLAITKMNKSKGFFDRFKSDVGQTVTGLGKGLPQLGLQAAKEAVAIPRVGINIAQGDDVSLEQLLTAAPIVGSGYQYGKAAITGKGVEGGYAPFTAGAGESMHRTGVRLSHPRQLAEDYSQRPFSSAVEDAGNVALVAGAAAKGASIAGRAAEGAGLARTASAANRVAKASTAIEAAGNRVAGAPFLPVSKSARLLNTAIGGGEILGREVSGVMPALARWERTRPILEAFHVTPEQRAMAAELRGLQERRGTIDTAMFKAFQKQEKILPRVEEQQAMYLVGQGQAKALAAARDLLPERRFSQLVDETVGKDYSREAVNLAADVVSGRNPALKTRIDEALAVGAEGRAAREAGAISRGHIKGQTGFDPLPEEIARQSAPVIRRLERALKVSDKAQLAADANRGRVARLQGENEFLNTPSVQRPRSGELGPSLTPAGDVRAAQRLGKELEKQAALDRRASQAARVVERLQQKQVDVELKAAQSIEAAPARLRPVLETNRAVAEALSESVRKLQDAGLDATMLAQIADDLPTTLKTLKDAGIDPDHFINPPERLKAGPGGGVELKLPRTGRMDETWRRTGKGLHEMTIRGQARAETRRAHQVVAAESVKQIETLPFVKHGSDFITAENGATRYPTRNELHAQGLEAWAPNTLFETAQTVGPDTIIIPKAVHDAFKSHFAEARWEKLLQRTYDPATRAFKTVVLPLSPAWNVGNAVTNAFMAVFAGGVDPLTLMRSMGDSIRTYRRTGEWPGPQRLYESGSTHEALDFLGNNPLERSKFSKVAGAPVRAGYGLNQTVDNLFRSAVYIAKKRKGYSDEVAMQMSLRAMGDFTKMSKFERNTVRRVVPFYAWLRHMSQVALRLPVEHPYRTAWILSMSNEFKDQEPWELLLPGFMQGFLPTGGDTTLSVQNFMPFSNPFAIRELGQNLSPQLKLLLTNVPGSPARGINPLTGRPYTRRPGTSNTDEFGRDLPTAPSILTQLRQIPPQLRTAEQLLGRKDVARYESGQTVLVRGPDGKLTTIPTPQSDTRTALKYAGLPTGSKKQLKQIADSIIARQVVNWKSANRKKKLSPSGSSSDPITGR